MKSCCSETTSCATSREGKRQGDQRSGSMPPLRAPRQQIMSFQTCSTLSEKTHVNEVDATSAGYRGLSAALACVQRQPADNTGCLPGTDSQKEFTR